MEQPTEKQIQWFWGKCEVKRQNTSEYGRMPSFNYPKIDLDNLFKYAVPKIDGIAILSRPEIPDIYAAQVRICNEYFDSKDKDPVLALFWAIYKAFGGKIE